MSKIIRLSLVVLVASAALFASPVKADTWCWSRLLSFCYSGCDSVRQRCPYQQYDGGDPCDYQWDDCRSNCENQNCFEVQ